MAKKDIPLVVSGMGLAMSIITSLADAVRKLGGTDEDIHRLATPEGAGLIQKFAEMIVSAVNPFATVFINPAKLFLRDMTKEGWELLQDVKYKAGEVQLKLVEFFKPGESSVRGDVMAERAKELGANLGQKHAEFLLENQHLIPVKFRKFYLTFPGTVWRDLHGDRRVLYLLWCGGRWCLNFEWLKSVWHGYGRLLGLRKPACR